MSTFSVKVLALVKKIPKGKVATYGQIARLAGKAHAARGVGWILNACAESHNLPWQRVINSQGKISFPPKTKEHVEQKRLLASEGIQFHDRTSLDLGIYQWKKEPKTSRPDHRSPSLFR